MEMMKEYKYLEQIDSPSDLRKQKISDLPEICDEIRDYIIKCCATNPGHLGSSIGAVELVVGMHYVFNTPEDKIVFDVGHQAYAHKILTGRKELFKKNRTKEGISGFPNRDESDYDAFGTGHSSTSISSALGIAEANKMLGKKSHVIAFIGDGAMTGGLAMEGLNNAKDTDLLIVLNDNNQSIDKNIGSVHDYLLKLTTNPNYNKIKSHIWNRMGAGKLRNMLQKCTIDAKSNLVRKSGGAFFESLGFRYFGPINGNNIEQVVEILGKLKDIKGPKILHAITQKGKGLKAAENDPTTWHAPGKYDLNTFKRIASNYKASRYQDVFGEVLLELSDMDDRVTGITPAMCTGCGMTIFANQKPNRFFDVGIEEEHAVTFSAGLAAAGMKPFCNIYSSFSQRAYDQIIHDIALQHLPVVLCFDRAGLVGEDGATHQGAFDMAAYRSIPEAIISSPRNETELKNLMYTGLFIESGPYIIRYPRGTGEGTDWKNADWEKLPVGKGEKLADGEKIAILGIGPVVNRAIEAANVFKEKMGWSPAVYDMRFLKPADPKILEEAGKNYQGIITVEEGCLKGGLFSEITEYMAEHGYKPTMKGCGIPDQFIRHDRQEGQRRACGLDTSSLEETLEKICKEI